MSPGCKPEQTKNNNLIENSDIFKENWIQIE